MAYLAPLFDSFYLGRDVQRNLGAVRAARAWCDAHGKKLCILANSGCLRNCPWQTFHDNLVAHSSAALKRVNVKGWSPHLCWTLYQDAANFPEILKATWIRPEDIHRYDGLVDVVKLATRQHANPDMVIGAYERNAAFPPDWFEKTGACPRECTGCGYCERVFETVCRTIGEEREGRAPARPQQNG